MRTKINDHIKQLTQDPDIISKLLILFTSITSISDYKKIARHLCNELKQISGVKTVFVQIEEIFKSSDANKSKATISNLLSELNLSKSSKKNRIITVNNKKKDKQYLCFKIESKNNYYGCILFDYDNMDDIKIYQATIESFANTIVLQLEKQVNEIKIKQLNRQLNKKIEPETEKIEKSESLYKVLVETSRDLIWQCDSEGRYTYLNPAWEEVFGFKIEEMIGRKFSDFQSPEYAKRDSKQFLRLLKGDTVNNLETVHLGKDGREISLIFNAKFLRDSDGNVAGTRGTAHDITEQKNAAAEIDLWMKRYKAIIKASGQILYDWDPKKKEVVYGGEIEQLLGYRLEEMGDDLAHWISLIHPEDVKKFSKDIDRVISEKEAFHLDYRVRKRDGSYIYVKDDGYFILDNKHNIVRMVGFVKDITKSLETENARIESESRYRTLFEYAPDGILIADKNSIYLDANKSICLMLGYSREELIGKHASDIVEKTEIKNIEPALEIINRNSEYQKDWRFVSKDGTIIPAEVSVVVMPDGNLMAIIRDTSERELAAKNLLEEVKLKVQILESTLDGYILADIDGVILDVNPAYCNKIGYTKEELLKMNMRQLDVAVAPEEMNKRIRQMISKGKDRFETKHKHKNGTILDLEVSISIMLIDELPRVAAFIRNITERKKVQGALKESETRLRFALEGANDGIWDVQMSTGQVYISPRGCEILGYRPDELKKIIKKWDQLVHPEDMALTVERLGAHLSGDSPVFDVVQRLETKSGEWKWIHTRGKVAERDANGTVLRMTGTHKDISERKLVEETIRRNEEILRLFVENSPASIAMFDKQMRYILASRRYCTDYNLGEIDLIGRSHYEIFPEITEEWMSIHKRCLAGETLKRDEDPFPRSDGKVDWVRWEIRPWYEKEKEIGGIILFSEVITERKFAEIALKDSEEELRALFASMSDVILVLNSEGKYLKIAPTSPSLLFKPGDELLGKKIPDIFDKELSDIFLKAIQKSLKSGSTINVEYSLTIEEKIIFFMGSVSPMSKDTVIWVARDITDRKHAEMRILDAKELAEKSNKLKGEFLAQMSHEIRSPISIILNYFNLIKDEVIDKVDPEISEWFLSVESASDRIIRTIDLILNVSEVQIGTYEPIIKPLDIYNDVILLLHSEYKQKAYEKELSFEILTKAENFIINADHYSSTQIFANLIDNAIKYTLEGEVTIIIERDENNKLVVSVADTGVGVAEEFIPQLFSSFTQEEQGYTRTFEGTGLGLTLVKSYCDINNAVIEAVSKKNVGTTFIVIFNTN